MIEAVDSLKDSSGNTIYPTDLYKQGKQTTGQPYFGSPGCLFGLSKRDSSINIIAYFLFP